MPSSRFYLCPETGGVFAAVADGFSNVRCGVCYAANPNRGYHHYQPKEVHGLAVEE